MVGPDHCTRPRDHICRNVLRGTREILRTALGSLHRWSNHLDLIVDGDNTVNSFFMRSPISWNNTGVQNLCGCTKRDRQREIDKEKTRQDDTRQDDTRQDTRQDTHTHTHETHETHTRDTQDTHTRDTRHTHTRDTRHTHKRHETHTHTRDTRHTHTRDTRHTQETRDTHKTQETHTRHKRHTQDTRDTHKTQETHTRHKRHTQDTRDTHKTQETHTRHKRHNVTRCRDGNSRRRWLSVSRSKFCRRGADGIATAECDATCSLQARQRGRGATASVTYQTQRACMRLGTGRTARTCCHPTIP